MKIYFLNPPYIKNFVRCGRWQGVAARGKTLNYPIWLSYAASFIEKEGYEVKLTDAIAKDWDQNEVLKDVLNFKPDIIVVDTNFSSLKNDLNISNLLKEKTSAITIIVGPPASQFPEEIVNGGADFASRFEFGVTIKEIAESLERGDGFGEIKGISYKNNDKITHNPNREPLTSEVLEDLPFISEFYKKHVDIKDYFLSHSLYPMVQIFTGRGCPNYCTFCSWPETLMGRKYRVRSVKNVVDEFEYITKELPEVNEIFIEDDSFTIDKKRLTQFCDELIRRNIKISWSCQSRADLNYETMKKMKKSGCRLLDVGYESGNDEILQNIKKGVDVNQLKEFTKNAKRAGLKILADFVIGFPGENKETANKTIDFIKEIKPNLLQVAVATPMPGTEFYDYCKEGNYLLTEDMAESLDESGFQKCIISYPDLSSEEISAYVDTALKGYYLNVSYIPIALKNVMGKNGFHELKGLMASAKMYLNYMRTRT